MAGRRMSALDVNEVNSRLSVMPTASVRPPLCCPCPCPPRPPCPPFRRSVYLSFPVHGDEGARGASEFAAVALRVWAV